MLDFVTVLIDSCNSFLRDDADDIFSIRFQLMPAYRIVLLHMFLKKATEC